MQINRVVTRFPLTWLICIGKILANIALIKCVCKILPGYVRHKTYVRAYDPYQGNRRIGVELYQNLSDRQLSPPSIFLNSDVSTVMTGYPASSTAFLTASYPSGTITVPFIQMQLAP